MGSELALSHFLPSSPTNFYCLKECFHKVFDLLSTVLRLPKTFEKKFFFDNNVSYSNLDCLSMLNIKKICHQESIEKKTKEDHKVRIPLFVPRNLV